MKDYSNEILEIIISGLKTGKKSDAVMSQMLDLPELSAVVGRINSLIKNEILSMEKEIVVLTEQLLESDYLLAVGRKQPTVRLSRSKSKREEPKMINN